MLSCTVQCCTALAFLSGDCLSNSPPSSRRHVGESIGSVPVKFGISEDGRSISVSERISIALTIKRRQDGESMEEGESRQEGENREVVVEQEQPVLQLQGPLSMQKWREVQDTLRRTSPSKE
jgi:hypothetical protein